MKILTIPKGIFNAVCYSADGQYLVGIHSGWRLRIWSTVDFTERYTSALPGILYSHSSLTLLDHLAVGSDAVYDLRELWQAIRASAKPVIAKKLLREVTLEEPFSPFARYDYCTDGRVILRTVHDWQAKCCRLSFWDAGGHKVRSHSISYVHNPPLLSPNGEIVAVYSGREVGLHRFKEDSTIGPLAHTDNVTRIAFSPDTRQLACAAGRSLWLWDIETGKGERFPAYDRYIDSIAYHPNGSLLAAGDRTGEIRLLEPSSGRQLTNFDFKVGAIHGLAFAPDGSTVAGAGHKNAVVVWDVE
jgi:WD40 repeat protein